MSVTSSQSQMMKFALLSKNVLSTEEEELYELAQLAGITLDPNVFKILMDLLKMNVAPTAILQMLKSMFGLRRKKQTTGEKQANIPQKMDRNTEQVPHRSRSGSGSRGRVPSGSRKPESHYH